MNVNEMTCEQVNEAIAKLRLEWVDDSAETVRDGWRQINVPLRPFDYCRDWAACGPLLEEIAGDQTLGVGICHYGEWEVEITGATLGGETLPEAVARAWLRWKMEAAS